MATITEKKTRRNKKTQLLATYCALRSAQLTSAFCLRPPPAAALIHVLLPYPLPVLPCLVPCRVLLKLCVFICGILRIYLFWLFYNIPATVSLSQPSSPPRGPLSRPHASAIWVFPILSVTLPPSPSSALPHSSNAVATSVTRFSLFPFQFFRCVLWQLSACSRCSFLLALSLPIPLLPFLLYLLLLCILTTL